MQHSMEHRNIELQLIFLFTLQKLVTSKVEMQLCHLLNIF